MAKRLSNISGILLSRSSSAAAGTSGLHLENLSGEEGEVLSHGFDYFDEDEDLSEDEDDEYADSDDSGDN